MKDGQPDLKPYVLEAGRALVALAPAAPRAAAAQALTLTPTPGKSTCEDVAALLGLPLTQTVKSLVLATDTLDDAGAGTGSQVWLLLVRGDHELNEVKAADSPTWARSRRTSGASRATWARLAYRA